MRNELKMGIFKALHSVITNMRASYPHQFVNFKCCFFFLSSFVVVDSIDEPCQSKEILPEGHLRQIARLLKGNEWEVLATFLDFNLASIEQRRLDISDEHGEDKEGRENSIFAMLVSWKRMKGNVTSIHTNQLANALIKTGRPDLAESLHSGMVMIVVTVTVVFLKMVNCCMEG